MIIQYGLKEMAEEVLEWYNNLKNRPISLGLATSKGAVYDVSGHTEKGLGDVVYKDPKDNFRGRKGQGHTSRKSDVTVTIDRKGHKRIRRKRNGSR